MIFNGWCWTPSAHHQSPEGFEVAPTGVIPKNTILWAVSRSRSTAFERAIMQRTDTEVFHEVLSEPFLKQHYPEKYALIEAARERYETSVAQPCYDTAMRTLACPPENTATRLKFSKEVSYFVDFGKITDQWLAQFRHVFLVRKPIDVMKSLYRVGQAGDTAYFDPSETGFSEIDRIFRLVCRVCDAGDILVLDSDADLMHDPETCLRRFCEHCGLEFDPGMLSWAPGPVDKWQFFKGWHNEAEQSKGFENPRHKEIDYPGIVEETAADCQTIYRSFQWHATLGREHRDPGTPICLEANEDAQANLLIAAEQPAQLHDAFSLAAELEPRLNIWCVDQFETAQWLCAGGRHLQHDIYDLPLFVLSDRALNATWNVQHRDSDPRCIAAVFDLDSDGAAPTRLRAAKLSGAIADTLVSLAKSHEREAREQCRQQAQAVVFKDWYQTLKGVLDERSDCVLLDDGIHPPYTTRQLVCAAQNVLSRMERALPDRERPDRGWIAIRMRRSSSTVVAFTACLLGGYPFIEIPDWYTDHQIGELLKDIDPVAVVADHSVPEDVVGGYPFVGIDFHEIRSLPDIEPPEPLAGQSITDPETTVYGILTSGTTGVAKIVDVPYRALLDSIELWRKHAKPDDRIGINAWLPGYIFYAMFNGGTSVVIPDDVILNPDALSAFIRDQQLSQIMITPTVAVSIIQFDKDAVKRLRGLHTIWLSGEKVPAKLIGRLNELLPDTNVIDLYGSNEAGDVAVKYPGKPLQTVPGVQAIVLDETSHRLTAQGCVGELCIWSPGLFTGYRNDPDAASAAFVANPLAAAGTDLPKMLYRTGDCARQLGGMQFEVLSRTGSHEKIRGFKVALRRVQAVLEEHRNVASVFVATRGEGVDKQLTAYIIPRDRSEILYAEDLSDLARQKLPSYSVPVAYFRVDGTHASRSQKSLSSHEHFGDISSPLPSRHIDLTSGQKKIASVWKQVLGDDLPNFKPGDSFLEFGGSLMLAKLAKALSSSFKTTVDIADIIKDPTLRGMAGLIEALRDGRKPSRNAISIRDEADRHRLQIDEQLDGPGILRLLKDRSAKTYFLTGATGYLGSYLLDALVRSPDTAMVDALVRRKARDNRGRHDAPAPDTADLHSLHKSLDEPGRAGKINVVEGDLVVAQFGLSKEYITSRHDRIDCVIHAAADVNWVKPYNSLMAVNVEGTVKAIELAARCHAPLIFISTLAEERPSTGYNESKLVAEELITAAHASFGLPYAILRCGDLAPPCNKLLRAGFNENDYFIALLASCLELKRWPHDVDWSVNLSPVDYVGELIARIASGAHLQAMNATHDIVNPKGDVSWTFLCRSVREAGIIDTFEPIDLKDWEALLAAAGPEQRFAQKAQVLLDMTISDLEAATQLENCLQIGSLPPPALGEEWCVATARRVLDALQTDTQTDRRNTYAEKSGDLERLGGYAGRRTIGSDAVQPSSP